MKTPSQIRYSSWINDHCTNDLRGDGVQKLCFGANYVGDGALLTIFPAESLAR